MRNFLLILMLLGNHSNSFSQDDFQNAIIALNSELNFKQESESYSNSKKPNEKIINQFKRCSEFESLEKLSELNFENITSVKSTELFTSKWKGKKQIEFQEWKFESEKYARNFIDILENLKQSEVQFCVNKGGIMWWRNDNEIYILTSRAYFMTYHYEEIKEVIKSGLKK